MKILFAEEADGWLAISQDVEYNGFLCEEIIHCEIKPDFSVVWQDNWKEAIPFTSLEDAKYHVLSTYNTHTPVIIGNRHKLEESL